jgi:hypothetical protein
MHCSARQNAWLIALQNDLGMENLFDVTEQSRWILHSVLIFGLLYASGTFLFNYSLKRWSSFSNFCYRTLNITIASKTNEITFFARVYELLNHSKSNKNIWMIVNTKCHHYLPLTMHIRRGQIRQASPNYGPRAAPGHRTLLSGPRNYWSTQCSALDKASSVERWNTGRTPKVIIHVVFLNDTHCVKLM